MAAFDLQYRELLPFGTELELDQLVSALNATIEENHHSDSGEHSAIKLDSLTTRNADSTYQIAIDGSLKFLKTGLYFDEPGNNNHVAGLRPVIWAGNQNDYNPPGVNTCILLECESAADRDITGIQRNGRQKRLLIFGNRGNNIITLKHNNAGSVYSNRFGLPGNLDVALGGNEYLWLYYDIGSEIWRTVSVI